MTLNESLLIGNQHLMLVHEKIKNSNNIIMLLSQFTLLCLKLWLPSYTIRFWRRTGIVHICFVCNLFHVLSLIGDSSFFLCTWLMTPLHIPQTTAEYRYNMAHSATHNIIERTFRTIRSRFRCLDGSKGTLQYSPEKAGHIVLACCVLHNISRSLSHGLDVWSSPTMEPMEQSEEEYEQMESLDSEADKVRQELMLTHFS